MYAAGVHDRPPPLEVYSGRCTRRVTTSPTERPSCLHFQRVTVDAPGESCIHFQRVTVYADRPEGPGTAMVVHTSPEELCTLPLYNAIRPDWSCTLTSVQESP